MPHIQCLFLHNVAGPQPQAIRQNAHGPGLFRRQLHYPTTIKNQPIEFVRLTTGQQWTLPFRIYPLLFPRIIQPPHAEVPALLRASKHPPHSQPLLDHCVALFQNSPPKNPCRSTHMVRASRPAKERGHLSMREIGEKQRITTNPTKPHSQEARFHLCTLIPFASFRVFAMSCCNCIFSINSMDLPKAFSKRSAISEDRLARPFNTALRAGRPTPRIAAAWATLSPASASTSSFRISPGCTGSNIRYSSSRIVYKIKLLGNAILPFEYQPPVA
jgi:hypothetical protein